MAEEKTAWEQAADWFARTIAIVIVMISPGALGAWLDKLFGSEFLAGLGFVLGMALAIALLMVFTRIKKIDNDGPVMGGDLHQKSSETTKPSTAAKKSAEQNSTSATAALPSSAPLPELPGAEVFEAPKSDE